MRNVGREGAEGGGGRIYYTHSFLYTIGGQRVWVQYSLAPYIYIGSQRV